MNHVVLFLYFFNISAGIAGFTSMALLHSKLKHKITASFLFVMGCLLLSLVLTLAGYYLSSVLGLPDYAIHARYLLALILAILARLGIMKVLFCLKNIPKSLSVSVTAAVLTVHIVNFSLAAAGKSRILEAIYLPSVSAVSLYLFAIGLLLLRGAGREENSTARFLLRMTGLLLAAFGPASAAFYFVFSYFPVLQELHISLDFLFFLVWSLINVSAFLRYLRVPSALLENGKISEGFIRKYGITAREEEVIHLISQGLANREIAEKLFVSLTTARTHIYNLFKKTGAKSRVELLKIVTGFRE